MKDNHLILLGVIIVIAIAGGAYLFMSGPSCADDSCGAETTGLVTAPVDVAQDTASNEGAATGDTVSVYYVGRLATGEVFDTTDEAIALENELPVHTDPLGFTIGEGQMIPGFEEAVKGMKEGETKTITIPAAEAYGEHDPDMVESIPRTETLERTQELERVLEIEPTVYENVFGKAAVVGDEEETAQLPWPVEVTEAGDTVKLKAVVKEGDVVALTANWDSTIIAVTDEKILVRAEPEDGQEIDTQLGKATIGVTDDELIVTYNPEVGDTAYLGYSAGVVTEITDEEIKVDMNHRLAGEDLTFEITLATLEKKVEVKSDRPTLDMYVMSFCPYGQQAEAGVGPVYRLLGDKIGLNPHFVVYGTANYAGKEDEYCEGGACSMHGLGELHEDMRQMCLWESEPAKWWDYVDCINDKTTYKDVDGKWKECAAEAGVDAAAVESCQSGRGIELMLAEKAVCQENGVSGSPTLFINGQKYKGNRDAESIKAAVCDAFNTPPAECSQDLGTETVAATGSC